MSLVTSVDAVGLYSFENCNLRTHPECIAYTCLSGKKIKSGQPSFMKRWSNASDSVTFSLQCMSMTRVPLPPSFQNSLFRMSSVYGGNHIIPKLEYVKFTTPSSQQAVEKQLDEGYSYITKAYNRELGMQQSEIIELEDQESDEFPAAQESGMMQILIWKKHKLYPSRMF